ncbi:MAG: hypothetical protein OHK0048_09530 [Rhodoferax sp.]
MSMPNPFTALEAFFQKLPKPDLNKLPALPQPPDWVVGEAQRRLVLLLNHVLMKEPQATERLRRHARQVMLVQWRDVSLRLMATPAGLLDLGDAAQAPDLRITVVPTQPFAVAQAMARGERPPVRIEGDVQLAAEVQWLIENVRWDIEDDLARVIGDVPARVLVASSSAVVQAVRDFVVRARGWVGGESRR